MSRDFFINGESLVRVKGNTGTSISSITELGLTTDPIRVRPIFKYKDMKVDAWGEGTPETQFMLSEVHVSMNFIHFDEDVLETCVKEAMGGASAFGTLTRAGSRLGGNQPRFAAGNHFVGLNITSPIAVLPWRFFFAYMANAFEFPLGTEKSIVPVTWRVIPYTQDPYQGGAGAQGQVLWDRNSD